MGDPVTKWLIAFLFATQAFAGLPPTTSKGASDSNDVTTFNFRFPNLTPSHSGVVGTLSEPFTNSSGQGIFYINTADSHGDNYVIEDPSNIQSIRYNSRILMDNNGGQSLNWASRYARDNANTNSFDYQSRLLYDSSGNTSIDWASRLMRDASTIDSIDWRNRLLYDSSDKTSLDYDNRRLYDTTGSNAVVTWDNGTALSCEAPLDQVKFKINANSSQTADLMQVYDHTPTLVMNIDKDGNIAATNLSGTNTGDVTLTAVGSSPNANGASLSGQALTLQPADGSNPGVCTASAQTFGGVKTFSSAPIFSALTASTPLYLDSSKALTSGAFSGNTTTFATTSGTLTSGDCVEFDSSGNLVAAGSPCGSGGGTPGGSSGAVQYNNSGSFGGFGSWDGSDLTVASIIDSALTASKPVFTDGSKRLTSSGTVPLNQGGTGQTTKAAAFDALSPMTTAGDLIYGGASGTGTRLGIGSTGQVLTVNSSGDPQWANLSTGVVTSWQSYTPTIGSGAGTASNVTFFWRQVGDSVEVFGTFTTGTIAGSLVSVTLPGSLTIDSSKITLNNNTGNPGTQIGRFSNYTNTGSIVTATASSTSLVYFGDVTNNTNQMLIPQNGNHMLQSSTVVGVHFFVPISGWSSVTDIPYRLTFAGNSSGTSVCSGSPCTIVSQSGSWVSSVTRSGAGTYQVNFSAGTFSSAPTCTCTSTGVGGNDFCSGRNAIPTTSSWSLNTLTPTPEGNDEVVMVTCIGPK